MPGFVIKNLPPELHRRLKEEAKRNRRSMTNHALVVLEQALTRVPIPKDVEPPEPIDLGSIHDHKWIYRAIRLGRT